MEPAQLQKKIGGVLVVMTTPFTPSFEVDIEGLKKNVQFLIESGIRTGSGALVAVGSNGECHVLSIEERKKVAEVVVDEAKGRVPVIIGCNHTAT